MAGEYSPAMHVHAGTRVYPNTRQYIFGRFDNGEARGCSLQSFAEDELRLFEDLIAKMAFMCVFAMLCLALLACYDLPYLAMF